MARAALDCIDPLLSNPTAQLNTKLNLFHFPQTNPKVHLTVKMMKNDEFLTFSEVVFCGSMMNMKNMQPLVICATGYPLHGDAMSGYLSGFYEVASVGHSLWQDGLKELDTLLASGRPVAVIVDDTFPHEPGLVAQRITATRSRNGEQSGLGLIYVDAHPNIFRVLRCLDQGYHAYLFLGDDLSASLKSVVDRTRHGERCLSTTVRGLYERYTLYQGLFSSLSDALMSTFKMMGEGLTIQQMVVRSGLRPSVIYRRQFRLRQHFGVASNEQLLELIQGMFEDQEAMSAP